MACSCLGLAAAKSPWVSASDIRTTAALRTATSSLFTGVINKAHTTGLLWKSPANARTDNSNMNSAL